jgi:hypothetical protein
MAVRTCITGGLWLCCSCILAACDGLRPKRYRSDFGPVRCRSLQSAAKISCRTIVSAKLDRHDVDWKEPLLFGTLTALLCELRAVNPSRYARATILIRFFYDRRRRLLHVRLWE